MGTIERGLRVGLLVPSSNTAMGAGPLGRLAARCDATHRAYVPGGHHAGGREPHAR